VRRGDGTELTLDLGAIRQATLVVDWASYRKHS
jgi:hypothetical protein